MPLENAVRRCLQELEPFRVGRLNAGELLGMPQTIRCRSSDGYNLQWRWPTITALYVQQSRTPYSLTWKQEPQHVGLLVNFIKIIIPRQEAPRTPTPWAKLQKKMKMRGGALWIFWTDTFLWRGVDGLVGPCTPLEKKNGEYTQNPVEVVLKSGFLRKERGYPSVSSHIILHNCIISQISSSITSRS